MMEGKHTPGPWKIDAGPRSYAIKATEGLSKAKCICDMRLPQDNGVPIKQIDANACFIVKACNSHYALLDACKIAIKAYCGTTENKRKIKAAIALAEKP